MIRQRNYPKQLRRNVIRRRGPVVTRIGRVSVQPARLADTDYGKCACFAGPT